MKTMIIEYEYQILVGNRQNSYTWEQYEAPFKRHDKKDYYGEPLRIVFTDPLERMICTYDSDGYLHDFDGIPAWIHDHPNTKGGTHYRHGEHIEGKRTTYIPDFNGKQKVAPLNKETFNRMNNPAVTIVDDWNDVKLEKVQKK